MPIASFNEQQARWRAKKSPSSRLPIEVHADRTSELIQLGHCCMACSGSVSLELMYYAKPSVDPLLVEPPHVLFRQDFMLQVKYMTLVNLLACDDRFDMTHAPFDPNHPGADQVPFPEYPTCTDKSAQIAAHVVEWLTEPAAYRRRVDQLVGLRSRFCVPGATLTAANYILDQLLGGDRARTPKHERAA